MEPEAKWLALESICRRNLNELIGTDSYASSDSSLRLQYMTIVDAAANALEIKGLDVPTESVSDFDRFLMSAIATSTRLQLKLSSSNHSLSVALKRSTKFKIHEQIERLRVVIAGADLPDKLRKSLQSKLDELQSLVVSHRVDYGKIMAILAFIGAGLYSTTGFLADAPGALGTITALIGTDKVEEDEEQRLIESERSPLQLPPPSTNHASDDSETPL